MQTTVTPPCAQGLPQGCHYIPLAHWDIDDRAGSQGVCTVLRVDDWGVSELRYFVPKGARTAFRKMLGKTQRVTGKWPTYEASDR